MWIYEAWYALWKRQFMIDYMSITHGSWCWMAASTCHLITCRTRTGFWEKAEEVNSTRSSLLFLFWQNKSRLKRSPCFLCVCMCTPLSSVLEYLNQSLWNLVCVSWHPSPSQRHMSQIPPTSLCVCMCTTPTTVRQQLGKHVPAAMKTCNTRRTGQVIFYAVHIISKESRPLVLPRTSCFKMRKGC
jgi:hypothetical protein